MGSRRYNESVRYNAIFQRADPKFTYPFDALPDRSRWRQGVVIQQDTPCAATRRLKGTAIPVLALGAA